MKPTKIPSQQPRQYSKRPPTPNYVLYATIGVASFAGVIFLIGLVMFLTSGTPEKKVAEQPPNQQPPLKMAPPTTTTPRPKVYPPKVDPPKPEPRRSLEGTCVFCDSGDTVQVMLTGQRRPILVKMIGLDAPIRSTREVKGQEPHGTESHQYLLMEIVQEPVKVEFDIKETEQGRKTLWGYVWHDGRLMNEEVLRNGHAMLATDGINIKYVDRLREAQRDAREAQVGIWSRDNTMQVAPSAYLAELRRIEAEQEALEKSLSIPKFQPGCFIGNRNTRRYHLPGGQYYEGSKQSKYAIFFESEEKARQAGYEPSAR